MKKTNQQKIKRGKRKNKKKNLFNKFLWHIKIYFISEAERPKNRGLPRFFGLSASRMK